MTSTGTSRGKREPGVSRKPSASRRLPKESKGRLPVIPTILHPTKLPFISDRIGRASAATIEGLAPEAALHARRNFRLGVTNGIMFTLVDALFAPSIVLAWYISRLGAPNIWSAYSQLSWREAGSCHSSCSEPSRDFRM